MNTNKKKENTEYLSNDIIDDDFLKSYKPFYLFQLLMGSSRIYVHNRFVSPPSFLQKCYTLVIVILIIIFDYISIQLYSFLPLPRNDAFFYLGLSVTILHSFMFICSIIHVRFFNNELCADYFVKLQQIDRMMKLDRNKTVITMNYKTNVFAVSVMIFIFFGILGIASSIDNISALYCLGISYRQFNFVLEIACCSCNFNFFYQRTRLVNCILYNYINPKNVSTPSSKNLLRSMYPSKKFLRHLAAQIHNFVNSETDLYLKKILQAFSISQTIYKFQIFLLCFKLVASCLLTFQFVLFAVQSEGISAAYIAPAAAFTLTDIMVTVNLVVRCELFLREVKETRRLANTVMSIHVEGRLRDKAKKMLKLLEVSSPRLSVYEMWELDAHVILRIFMLVTTLIFTELQFVFL